MTVTRERLAIGAALVIIALTVAAFWLSYAHLHAVAASHGLAASPARAWAWPATLDLFIVSGELLMLRASLGRKTDWWAIGLTVVGSTGSITLNVFGVGGSDPLAYVTAAVPPTAALLAFGALMRQVHSVLAEQAESDAAAGTHPAATPKPASATAHPQRATASPAAAIRTVATAATASPKAANPVVPELPVAQPPASASPPSVYLPPAATATPAPAATPKVPAASKPPTATAPGTGAEQRDLDEIAATYRALRDRIGKAPSDQALADELGVGRSRAQQLRTAAIDAGHADLAKPLRAAS